MHFKSPFLHSPASIPQLLDFTWLGLVHFSSSAHVVENIFMNIKKSSKSTKPSLSKSAIEFVVPKYFSNMRKSFTPTHFGSIPSILALQSAILTPSSVFSPSSTTPLQSLSHASHKSLLIFL